MNIRTAVAFAVTGILLAGCAAAKAPSSSKAGNSLSARAFHRNSSSKKAVSSSSKRNPSAAQRATITIQGVAFAPKTLTVKKGTTVTWKNNDSVPHTVTGDAGGPSSQQLANGQSYSYTFSTIGTFPYHCTIHPSMTATVTVTP